MIHAYYLHQLGLLQAVSSCVNEKLEIKDCTKTTPHPPLIKVGLQTATGFSATGIFSMEYTGPKSDNGPHMITFYHGHNVICKLTLN